MICFIQKLIWKWMCFLFQEHRPFSIRCRRLQAEIKALLRQIRTRHQSYPPIVPPTHRKPACCVIVGWQVRERNQVEKVSVIWKARERNQSASATCSQTLILISSLWLNQSREDTGIHLQTGRCRGWWEKQQQGQWWGECQKLADVKRFALVVVEVSTFHYNVWFETP